MSVFVRQKRKKTFVYPKSCNHKNKFRYLGDFLTTIYVHNQGCNCNCTITIENSDDDEEIQGFSKKPKLNGQYIFPKLKNQLNFVKNNKKFKLYGLRGIYFDEWICINKFFLFEYEQIEELEISIEKHNLSSQHNSYYYLFNSEILKKFKNLKLLKISMFESNVKTCSEKHDCFFNNTSLNFGINKENAFKLNVNIMIKFEEIEKKKSYLFYIIRKLFDVKSITSSKKIILMIIYLFID